MKTAPLHGTEAGIPGVRADVAPKVLVLSMHLPPENVPCTLQAGFVLNSLREAGVQAEGLATSLSPFTGVQGNVEFVHRTPVDVESLRRLQRLETWFNYRFHVDEYGYSWIRFATRAAAELIERQGINGIISVSPPAASHLAALALKRKFPAIKWMAMFQDPYVDNPFRRPNIVWDALIRRRERAIFGAADRIVANTSSTLERWQSRYPQHANKLSVVWTGFDAAEPVRALPRTSTGRPVLTHVGSIYGGRRILTLFQSVLRLKRANRIRPIEISLVGDCELVPEDKELYNELAKDGWVRHTPKVSRKESLDIAGSADYLLMLDTNAQNESLQVPSKVFDYVRIGRPILCYTQRDSMSERILARSGIPHECICGDMSADQADESLLRFLSLSPQPVEPTDWFMTTFESQRQVAPVVSYFMGASGSGVDGR